MGAAPQAEHEAGSVDESSPGSGPKARMVVREVTADETAAVEAIRGRLVGLTTISGETTEIPDFQAAMDLIREAGEIRNGFAKNKAIRSVADACGRAKGGYIVVKPEEDGWSCEGRPKAGDQGTKMALAINEKIDKGAMKIAAERRREEVEGKILIDEAEGRDETFEAALWLQGKGFLTVVGDKEDFTVTATLGDEGGDRLAKRIEKKAESGYKAVAKAAAKEDGGDGKKANLAVKGGQREALEEDPAFVATCQRAMERAGKMRTEEELIRFAEGTCADAQLLLLNGRKIEAIPGSEASRTLVEHLKGRRNELMHERITEICPKALAAVKRCRNSAELKDIVGKADEDELLTISEDRTKIEAIKGNKASVELVEGILEREEEFAVEGRIRKIQAADTRIILSELAFQYDRRNFIKLKKTSGDPRQGNWIAEVNSGYKHSGAIGKALNDRNREIKRIEALARI